MSALAFQALSATVSVWPAASQASPLSMVCASPATPTVPSAQALSTLALSASVDLESMPPPSAVCQALSVNTAKQLTTMECVKGSVIKDSYSMRASASLEAASMAMLTMALVDVSAAVPALETQSVAPADSSCSMVSASITAALDTIQSLSVADANAALTTARPASMPTSASTVLLDIAPSMDSARPPAHAQLTSSNTTTVV